MCGFQEWDSNCYFNEDVLALAHLADLAADDSVAEMAAIILDKLGFTMALNSFNGVFGSTHGRSYTSLILGGRAERTSGISRLLWGHGTLNNGITGMVGLACAKSYEFPPILAAIATDTSEPLWNRERHAGQHARHGATLTTTRGKSIRSPTKRRSTCSARHKITGLGNQPAAAHLAGNAQSRCRGLCQPSRLHRYRERSAPQLLER